MDDDELVRRCDAGRFESPRNLRIASAISRHFHAVACRVRAPDGQPSIASSRSHWFTTECRRRSMRGRDTAVVYIQVRPGIS